MEYYSIFWNYSIWMTYISCPTTVYVFELVQKDGSKRAAEKCISAWGDHHRCLLSGMDLLKKVGCYVLLYKALWVSRLCSIPIVPGQEKLIYIVKRTSWGTENLFHRRYNLWYKISSLVLQNESQRRLWLLPTSLKYLRKTRLRAGQLKGKKSLSELTDSINLGGMLEGRWKPLGKQISGTTSLWRDPKKCSWV